MYFNGNSKFGARCYSFIHFQNYHESTAIKVFTSSISLTLMCFAFTEHLTNYWRYGFKQETA